MPSVMWFRRDLRLHDNPALLAAVAEARSTGDGLVVPLFVFDPRLWDAAGPVRRAYLVASLKALDEELSGQLLLRHGDPTTVVVEVARAAGATSVHACADFAPYGSRRDRRVAQALGDVALVRTGSPYAVAPARNRADLDGTSALSHHLRFGEIHPRSLLAELGDADEGFLKEVCWREFYADVLRRHPSSAHVSLDPRFDDMMRWTDGPVGEEFFEAWSLGHTGYPFVDAGMRQLRAEGWVQGRVRMVVASFLVKDLHLPWQRGAAEFMRWLRDGDLASNAHGWQWTAGCGTDAVPFYRVFNPVLQGLKFDPDGDYVRRYVPELRQLAGKDAHEPWKSADGHARGYPMPVVDHKAEREVALADFARVRASA